MTRRKITGLLRRLRAVRSRGHSDKGATIKAAHFQAWRSLEPLEERLLLSSTSLGNPLPYGADVTATSEYLLGDIWVTVVLLESNGGIDVQTENWTQTEINKVKYEVQEGASWWEEVYRRQFPNATIDLNFNFDFTYTDAPVPTKYEPINRSSSQQTLWIDEFLNQVGYNDSSQSIFNDLDRWNHDQRVNNGADWAYTVFIVDSSNDSDGKFSNGKFAYGYLGGPFMVMTYKNSGWGPDRMSHVFAHESGHMFYALDEYSGSDSYTAVSGYYATQNLNAVDGNPNPSSIVPSIMTSGTLQLSAWSNYTSSPTSLQMMGWQDSYGDGIFDVLDVPMSLTGSGSYDANRGQYRFTGSSAVQTLANQNPYGSRRNITLNRIDGLQYRLNDGPWIDGNSYDSYSTAVSQNVSVTTPGNYTIQFRTVSGRTGVVSNVWSGNFTVAGTVQPAEISFAQAQSSVGEANGAHRVDVVLTVPGGGTLTQPVSVQVVDNRTGAATAGSDYSYTTQTLTFPAGSTSGTWSVTLNITNDNVDELNETINLSLTSVSGPATLGGATHVATILDDDNSVISITDAVVTEGDSGLTQAVLTVSLSKPVDRPVTVQVNTANGTATLADNDYQAITGLTLTFNPGAALTQTVAVNVIADTHVEPDETFGVTLSSVVNAALGKSLGQVTILNDDFYDETDVVQIEDENQWLFDFGTDSSLVEAGYTGITANTVFNGTAGFGWLKGKWNGSQDRGIGNALTRDFVSTADDTFEVVVPNGTYEVTVTMGDPLTDRRGMVLYLENSKNIINTKSGKFFQKTFQVTVQDGRLSLRLASFKTWAVINALEVVAQSEQSGSPNKGKKSSPEMRSDVNRLLATLAQPSLASPALLASSSLPSHDLLAHLPEFSLI